MIREKERYMYCRYHGMNRKPSYRSCGYRVAVNITAVQSTPVAGKRTSIPGSTEYLRVLGRGIPAAFGSGTRDYFNAY